MIERLVAQLLDWYHVTQQDNRLLNERLNEASDLSHVLLQELAAQTAETKRMRGLVLKHHLTITAQEAEIRKLRIENEELMRRQRGQ